jgi:NADH-quinone oxidoreductase subunit I
MSNDNSAPLGPRKVTGTPIKRPDRSSTVQAYVPGIVDGLGITMKHFFKNTKEMILDQRNDPTLEAIEEGINTIAYPEQTRPYPERFRGVHRLTHRADGAPRCVACLCCSTACPAQCIHIVPGEYPEGDPRRGYERFPDTFVIDELRCVFCGFCVEACPVDAIRMDTGLHGPAYDSRDQFMFGKDMLMSFPGRDANYESENTRHEPGDSTHPGIDREKGH